MEIRKISIDDINGYLHFHSYDENDPITRKTKIALRGLLVHEFCHGFIDIQRISENYNALTCRSCKMRIPFPIEVKTYGQLKNYLLKRKLIHEKK
jgi:hypothetical protein